MSLRALSDDLGFGIAQTGPSLNYSYEHLFPFPVSDIYRRYRVARNPIEKLGYIFLGCENSVKLIVAAMIACEHEQASSEPISAGVLRQLGKPTLGSWIEVGRQLGKSLKETDNEMVNAIKECMVSSGKDGFLSHAERIVQERNKYIHVDSITETGALDALNELAPQFLKLMSEINFLANTHFILCEEIQAKRFPQCYEAVVRICRGSNPIFGFESWRLNQPLEKSVCYLVDSGVSLALCLSPLVVSSHAVSSTSPTFALINKAGPPPKWVVAAYPRSKEIGGTQENIDEVAALADGELLPSMHHLSFLSGRKPSWYETRAGHTPWCPAGFSFVGIVGTGRYAEVFQVLDDRTDRLYALKTMRANIADDPRLRVRFDREIRALTDLKGLGCAVSILKSGENDVGLPYMLTEYSDSGTLLERLLRFGALGIDEILDVGIELARKLSTIHNAGIIHRDVKLSNILGAPGEFQFCDFGSEITTADEPRITLDGDAIGTLGYMAPEQFHGSVDVRSDLYSLGVCLVFLIAGTEISNVRDFLREFDEANELTEYLLELVEKVPDNRPPSADAIVDRLSAIKTRLKRSSVSNDHKSAVEEKEVFLRGAHKISRWESEQGETFVSVHPGVFLMGATKYPDERPVHEVTIKEPFWACSTPVTNGQFREFVKRTGYRGRHKNFLLHIRDDRFSIYWKRPDCPVVFVSWIDAKEYILWRCEQEDRDYRLFTEAQWEYCARAGSRTVYPWGNVYEEGKVNADNTHGHPTVVGTYPSNTWGLYDMLGNVWEWCEDIKDVRPNKQSVFYRHCSDQHSECVDPVNSGVNAMRSRSVDANARVIRGGSFHSEGRNHRPANRRGQNRGDSLRSIGFRIALFGLNRDE